MEIRRAARRVVVVTISGSDVGEFGDAPFRALADDLAREDRIDLFINSRNVRGASIEVSCDWARWLGKHRDRLHLITMLIGSRYIDITANFVRRFAQLEGSMRLTDKPSIFEDALRRSLGESRPFRS